MLSTDSDLILLFHLYCHSVLVSVVGQNGKLPLRKCKKFCLVFIFVLFFSPVEHWSDKIKAPELGRSEAAVLSSDLCQVPVSPMPCVISFREWGFTQVWEAQLAKLGPQLRCDRSRSSVVPNRGKEEKPSVLTTELCGFEINFTLWGIHSCFVMYVPRKWVVSLRKLSSFWCCLSF